MPKMLSCILNNNKFTVSFKTNNNLVKLLRSNKRTPLEKKTGIYKLMCKYCDCFYIRQTERGFLQHFREHIPKQIRNYTIIT